MKPINIKLTIKLARNVAILLIFLAVSIPVLAKDSKVPSEKAAEVNGVAIFQEEHANEVNLQLEFLSEQGLLLSKEQITELKNEVLENLIDREILYQESKKTGINVNKKIVDEQLSDVKEHFQSEKEYKNALSTMELSEGDVKNQIKKSLAIGKLIEKKITQKIVVTDKETKSFYDANPNLFKRPEQVKASHILIKVVAGEDKHKKAEAKQKIKEVQTKLKSGQDFSLLAKEYSEDEATSNDGGDLGYFARGEIAKPLEDAAFKTQPNEVTDIIKTQFGYHLIKVYDKKPEQTLAYGEVKDMLTKSIKQEKTEEKTIKYIAELKKNVKIEKYL